VNRLLLENVKKLPRVPGVYLFKDTSGDVIYVGKAKRLKDRVGSYFQANLDLHSKTYALVQRISSLEYVEVQSELEALVLEAALIKKHRPKYNIVQKDDKSYLYIAINKERLEIAPGKKRVIPKILTVRETDINDKDILFGPYPNGTTAKWIVRTVRRIFPFRDCDAAKYKKYSKLEKPCLYGHLGLCPAPCVNTSEENIRDYIKNIRDIRKVLNGESRHVLRNMNSAMEEYSKNFDYENAARVRDSINRFKYISQKFRGPEEYMNNPYLIDDIAEMASKDLKDLLPFLNDVPGRIECYDISNISGKEAVGSMVVAINGRLEKSEYRKFKIKLKETPDDFLMMKEVLVRRLKRIENDHDKWPKPDLIVVDGGRGQVTSALEAMELTGQTVPVLGLAKKEEHIIFKEADFIEISYSVDTPGMQLLIRLRDEAHRFAQSYHHKLRLQKVRA
jgi:excinuclease ABC subunit C